MTKHHHIVEIDEVFYNASHYAGMPRADAVKAVIANGDADNKQDAEKIVTACRKKVSEMEKTTDDAQEAEAIARLEKLNRARVASGVEPVADAQTLTSVIAGQAPEVSAEAKSGKK